ncbi:MAG: hypothetical protein KBD64_00370 [Gammaproteobacteria bacterium]|nr:hypothetical protein [Gammaproteobacteria bacterium]
MQIAKILRTIEKECTIFFSFDTQEKIVNYLKFSKLDVTRNITKIGHSDFRQKLIIELLKILDKFELIDQVNFDKICSSDLPFLHLVLTKFSDEKTINKNICAAVLILSNINLRALIRHLHLHLSSISSSIKLSSIESVIARLLDKSPEDSEAHVPVAQPSLIMPIESSVGPASPGIPLWTPSPGAPPTCSIIESKLSTHAWTDVLRTLDIKSPTSSPVKTLLPGFVPMEAFLADEDKKRQEEQKTAYLAGEAEKEKEKEWAEEAAKKSLAEIAEFEVVSPVKFPSSYKSK